MTFCNLAVSEQEETKASHRSRGRSRFLGILNKTTWQNGPPQLVLRADQTGELESSSKTSTLRPPCY